MALLASILVVASLLGGFLFLTAVEKKRGTRVLQATRARLDVYVGDAVHAFRKLHAGEFTKRLKVVGAYIVHEFAHAVLIGVRALERTLTQTVRTLRTRHGVSPEAPHHAPEGRVE